MEENTSPAGGATPTPGTPAMGTAPVGATPAAAPSLTLEEALKKLAELEHSHGNAKEELDRHRKKLSSYEKLEKEQAEAKRLADEAQLSEIDRVKKQHAQEQSEKNALLLELQETKIHHAVERYARELHFTYPEIAVSLLNRAELEFEDNGTPKNVKQLLEKLAKAMPKLVEEPAPAPAAPPPSASSTPTAPARPSTPAIPAMNPGRTQIAPPGSNPPGRPIRLSDIRR